MVPAEVLKEPSVHKWEDRHTNVCVLISPFCKYAQQVTQTCKDSSAHPNSFIQEYVNSYPVVCFKYVRFMILSSKSHYNI